MKGYLLALCKRIFTLVFVYNKDFQMTSIKVIVQLLQWKKKTQKVEKQWKEHHMTKWYGTKEPLDESERGEWKSWLKTQHSKKWHPVSSLHCK